MPVPTHRPDCKTQLWKTTCPDCKKTVYYFSCSCGSRVFFDQKGWPWRQHADTCPVYQLRLMLQAGESPTAIRQRLMDKVAETGIPLPPEVEDFLRQRGQPVVEVLLPSDDVVSLSGRILKINHQVNFFRRFDYQENQFTRRLLDSLVSTEHAEVTVREENTQGRPILHEATFFLPLTELKALGLRQNQVVTVRLVAFPSHTGR